MCVCVCVCEQAEQTPVKMAPETYLVKGNEILHNENFHAAAIPAAVVHEMNVKVGAIIEG